jgi:adenine-specific DNA glycosylase
VECAPGSELAALRARWPEVAARPLGRVERTLTHRALTIEIFAVEHLPPPDGARWVTEEEAETLGISAAMQAVLKRVFDGRAGGGETAWKSRRSPRSRR